MSRLEIVFITLLLCLPAAAWQKPAAGAPAGKRRGPSPAVVRGQQDFAQTCAFCHGAAANGGAEAPSLIQSDLVRHDHNGDLISPVLLNGRPNRGMPQLGLSPQRIADLVAFLHFAVKQADHASPAHPHAALKLLLTGNAAAGKAWFNGPGGCTRCHSASGDLAGIAHRDQPAVLQARMLYPGRKPLAATITLPSGRQVHGRLLHLDAFNVAIQGPNGWRHSWPRGAVKVAVTDPMAAHRHLLETINNTEMHNLFAYLETLTQ